MQNEAGLKDSDYHIAIYEFENIKIAEQNIEIKKAKSLINKKV